MLSAKPLSSSRALLSGPELRRVAIVSGPDRTDQPVQAHGDQQRTADPVRGLTERSGEALAEKEPEDRHARLEQAEYERHPKPDPVVDAAGADPDRRGEVGQADRDRDEQQRDHGATLAAFRARRPAGLAGPASRRGTSPGCCPHLMGEPDPVGPVDVAGQPDRPVREQPRHPADVPLGAPGAGACRAGMPYAAAMRVALCQIPVSSDPSVNLARAQAAIASAAGQGAQLAVFPEGTQARFGTDLRAAAAPLDGAFGTGLLEAARAHGVAVVAGVFSRPPMAASITPPWPSTRPGGWWPATGRSTCSTRSASASPTWSRRATSW